MFVHYFVNYFMRLRTNHCTLLTISLISFIFDSARNLMNTRTVLLFDISWKYRSPDENGEMRDEKNDWRDSLQNAIYTPLVSPTFFSHSRQFDDKCSWLYSKFELCTCYFYNFKKSVSMKTHTYSWNFALQLSFICTTLDSFLIFCIPSV